MQKRPWHQHYDPGVPVSLEYPAVTVFHYLEESARLYPEKACTIFRGSVVTFREMDLLSDRIAAGLAALGVHRGDRVGLFMPNMPQFVMAYFGILKAGDVVVAINPLFTPPEIQYQVNDAGVEVLFGWNELYERLKISQAKTKIKTMIITAFGDTFPPFPRNAAIQGGIQLKTPGRMLQSGDLWFQDFLAEHPPEGRPSVAIASEDTALFQYTGGTTGIPKGAVALHRQIVTNILQTKAWLDNLQDGQEIVLMAIPMFHVYGMVFGMLFAIAAGDSLVLIPNARDLKELLETIRIYRPSVFPGVPTIYNGINTHPDVIAGQYDLSSIKACISGSAPLMQETKERFEALTGGRLREGYGLSEAPTATHCNPILGENRAGSIGLPFPDVDAKIISLEDGLTEMSVGEIGELVIQSPQVMGGYHARPDETANALRKLPDGSGPWLFTGDIARMDQDGFFYLVDRKKELIKSSGYQVWPREVEEAIAAYPKVLEVAAAGIPDSYRGEVVKAWIVVRPGENLEAAEIQAWCKERLAPYKIPAQIEFRSELPKTAVGKVLRRELVRQHHETPMAHT
jgi:long-chain acyl-CoA synthetase